MTTTVYVHVMTLEVGQTMIGQKGGHSHVYGIVGSQWNEVYVETEHGIVIFPTNGFVEIIVEE